jgi:anaerobic magnesium-protoporphyrin IX monomethyl ester cyclase
MNVLLVAPPIMDAVGRKIYPIAQDATRNSPPYGLYLLANVLRSEGHQVAFLDLIARGTNDISRFQNSLAEADLVGLGSTSLSWPTALEVIRQVRVISRQVPIVLGGIHATLFDVYILQRFPVQYVIRGEAERAFPALCEALERKRDLSTVPNLSRKTKDGKVVRNALGCLLTGEEIGSQPLPAYDLLPERIYQSLSIESSRGCAFDCAFCATTYRQTWRDIPPELFVNRLIQVMPHVKKTLSGTVSIVDDEFATNTKRATKIARLLVAANIQAQFCYDVRARDLLDLEFTETMAPLTNNFLLGAECGYDEGLEKIGKKTTCAQLESAAKVLSRFGLAERANFSFILGLPWERKEEILKTIEFASRLYSEYGVKILLQSYCLIPGSRLWQEKRDELKVSEAMYDDYGFFRNLHLWYTSQRLSPSEAWEIEDLLQTLVGLAELNHPGKKMIQRSIPIVLAKYFPRSILQADDHPVHLGSLRQVSHPSQETVRV